MNEANSTEKLDPIEAVGGIVVSDPEKSKTAIPPQTEVQIGSVDEKEPALEIKLEGEFPPRDKGKEQTNKDKGDDSEHGI